jgi:hypothetical protein
MHIAIYFRGSTEFNKMRTENRTEKAEKAVRTHTLTEDCKDFLDRDQRVWWIGDRRGRSVAVLIDGRDTGSRLRQGRTGRVSGCEQNSEGGGGVCPHRAVSKTISFFFVFWSRNSRSMWTVHVAKSCSSQSITTLYEFKDSFVKTSLQIFLSKLTLWVIPSSRADMRIVCDWIRYLVWLSRKFFLSHPPKENICN